MGWSISSGMGWSISSGMEWSIYLWAAFLDIYDDNLEKTKN